MFSPHRLHLSVLLVVALLALTSLSGSPREQTPTNSGASPSPSEIATPNLMPLSFHATPAQAQDAQAAFARLPLSFEPNRGQTDAKVKFLSRAGTRTLWLTNDEAVLALTRKLPAKSSRESGLKPVQFQSAILRMKFVGANSNTTVRGESPQPGTVNYFVGPSSQWKTNIPTYSRVRYQNLYKGIDLLFYGNNQQLEYDLVISPGADSGQIAIAIDGAQNIGTDAEGNLVLTTSAGTVVQQKPRIYQRKGATLTPVAGHYVIEKENQVRFALGAYDRASAVVIDPVLRYSTYLGGSDLDQGFGIVVDSANQAIVVGITCSPDFPVTNMGTPPSSGGCSGFISKFDFNASRLIFSSFMPDSIARSVALDSSGNIYVTGSAEANFPVTAGAFQTTFGGSGDAFVAKLKPSGSELVYATFVGGSGGDVANGIAVDSAGNAYITGVTTSTDFPTTPGVFQHDCNLSNDTCRSAFVTKLNALGTQAVYSTYLGGHATQSGNGIDVNSAGNAFVTGDTTSSDFPTTAGTAQPVFKGSRDAFVSQVSTSGSHLNYSTFLGGSDVDSGASIALDSFGNAFITGSTHSPDFPVKNAFQPKCPIVNSVCINAFVTKLNSSGRFLYSTFLGGGGDAGTGIAVTPGGQAYVAGFTHSTTFPTTQNAFQRVHGGGADIFITKFSPAGRLLYSSYLGGNGNDLSPAVALDKSTNAYLTAIVDFEAPAVPPTFPVTPGAFQMKPGGAGDAFLAKVVSLCALSTVNRSVTICSPGSGSSVASPVRIIAGTTDATPVKLTQVYVDGKKIYEAALSAINVALPIAAGTHRLTVQSFDTANAIFKKSITVTVH